MSDNIDDKDYSKSIIYIIYNINDPSLKYVGSTINLKDRIKNHHSSSKNISKLPVYKTINNNWDDWKIEIYEEYPCSCKKELDKREGEITKLIGTLNKNIAGRNQKEYYKDNINKILEHKKQYYQDNIDKIKQYKKQFYKDNTDKIKSNHKQYYKDNIDKIKKYCDDNKDKKKQYDKEYYLKKKLQKTEDILD
jgi:hypothetical protein